MKIEEGIRTLTGKPVEIPDCSRDDLPAFFKETGRFKGVEIGVYKGQNFEGFAKAGLDVTGIDPWGMYKDYGNPRGQARLDEQYEHTKRLVAPYPNAKLLRKKSMDALEDFEDGSLDFVYIDGNHQFAYVAEDIYHWAIKLKQGGILSGHDYARYKSNSICGGCHAKEVVDAYAIAYNLKSYFVLGRHKAPTNNDKSKGEIRDQFRSWLIVKDYETPQHVIKN